MPIISESEANEFIQRMDRSHEIIMRANNILSKNDASAEDRVEIERLRDELWDHNIWFERTAK